MNNSSVSGGGHARELGVYLLTPTHVGTGQAVGAIDLPIAREVHTQWPVIPSTALKGVARDRVEAGDRESGAAIALFGPRPPQKSGGEVSLKPGGLIFTDAQILAFPVASVSAPFYWVTSPMVIARWARARRAWGLRVPDVLPTDPTATFSPEGVLVLGDQVVRTDGGWTARSAALREVAKHWTALVPAEDGVAASMAGTLVCVDDATFGLLVTAGTAVNARVQLTDGKTTDTFTPEGGGEQKGNLWYEETLPSDCLFSAILAIRPSGGGKGAPEALETLVGALGGAAGCRLQVGGNETVGQGVFWWRTGAA